MQMETRVIVACPNRGGVLPALSAADGAIPARHPLATAPAYDGLAAARQLLFVSLMAGRLLCCGADGR